MLCITSQGQQFTLKVKVLKFTSAMHAASGLACSAACTTACTLTEFAAHYGKTCLVLTYCQSEYVKVVVYGYLESASGANWGGLCHAPSMTCLNSHAALPNKLLVSAYLPGRHNGAGALEERVARGGVGRGGGGG